VAFGQPVILGDNMSIIVPGPGDKDAWLPLWQGYLEFYGSNLARDVTDLTYERMMDPAEPVHVRAFVEDGRWLGFVAFVLHRSTWARAHYCYLEDLFVAPDARGRGVARQLIETVKAFAVDAECGRIYWMTQNNNLRAQALYDTLATKTNFCQYAIELNTSDADTEE
jgi:GNAT superfamily N-acetyltransferase